MADNANNSQWLRGGTRFYPAMLDAIARARESIDLEVYIFADDRIGRRFLAALTRRAEDGVRVRVLADAYGSLKLASAFFEPLVQAGGTVHFFNPLRFRRFGVRDHRKLLVCDRQTAFVGGANISESYDGDGVTCGWFDLMVKTEDPSLAAGLTAEFERIFNLTHLELRRLRKLRAFRRMQRRSPAAARLLPVRPGRGIDTFQRSLQHALRRAHAVDLMTPYFLPGRRLRKLLRLVARRGGRVRLLLPANCDVPIARAAGRIYYARLLRAGVEIYEYEPQILHAKLCLVDRQVFVGSSNLDIRSFKLNYELMLRFTDDASLRNAGAIFSEALNRSRRIELKTFRRSQNFWERWKNRWAHFLIARIDPFISLRQMDALPPPPAENAPGAEAPIVPAP